MAKYNNAKIDQDLWDGAEKAAQAKQACCRETILHVYNLITNVLTEQQIISRR